MMHFHLLVSALLILTSFSGSIANAQQGSLSNTDGNLVVGVAAGKSFSIT